MLFCLVYFFQVACKKRIMLCCPCYLSSVVDYLQSALPLCYIACCHLIPQIQGCDLWYFLPLLPLFPSFSHVSLIQVGPMRFMVTSIVFVTTSSNVMTEPCTRVRY